MLMMGSRPRLSLPEAALQFLISRDELITARANKDWDIAECLAEREEDARRVMADAICSAQPELTEQVRKVCKFWSSEKGNGVIDSFLPRNHHF